MLVNKLIVTAALWLVACGGAQSSQGGTSPDRGSTAADATDTRTELERRLEAACHALEPKLVACAVEDSRVELAAGRITQQQFTELTTPAMQAALGKDWDTRCNRRDRSSRQVRVLEVCLGEETECAPLLDCLENLNEPR